MSKFSEYTKSTSFSENTIKNDKEEKIDNYINRYMNFNQEQLIKEFVELTKKKKAKGELNSIEIERLKSTLQPFLSSEQLINLDKIINMVE